MKIIKSHTKIQSQQSEDALNLQEMQKMIACFEDEILPKIPSKDEILHRARSRRIKHKRMTQAIMMLVGSVVALYWYNPSYQNQYYATQIGSQQKHVLSDGSEIHLNTNTQVVVQQRLRSREMTLVQGEATFSVKHIDMPMMRWLERPFEVTAGNLLVRDVGTIFNIDKASDDQVTVTVLQGVVDIKHLYHLQPAIRLYQGQSITSHDMTLDKVHKVNLYSVSAWHEGKLVFEHTPLKDAISNFQRYADFKIEIQDPSLQQLPVYGQFQVKNYQQFIDVLPQVMPVQVEKIGTQHWKIKKK